MNFLHIMSWLWPIAVVLTPVVLGTGFLWLKDKFPTKDDLSAAKTELATKIDATEQSLSEKIDEHEERLDVGSKKMAELDKRTALTEEECRAMPSRHNLQAELSNLSQRVRGVEVWTESTSKQLETLNSYLHTLIERGLGGVK